MLCPMIVTDLLACSSRHFGLGEERICATSLIQLEDRAKPACATHLFHEVGLFLLCDKVWDVEEAVLVTGQTLRHVWPLLQQVRRVQVCCNVELVPMQVRRRARLHCGAAKAWE